MNLRWLENILLSFSLLNLTVMLTGMETPNEKTRLIKSEKDEEKLFFSNNPQQGLHNAIKNNQLEFVKEYLRLGAQINPVYTPEKKIDWHNPTKSYFSLLFFEEKKEFSRGTPSPLFKALQSTPNPQIVEFLCKQGANVNEHNLYKDLYYQENEGLTPLHYLIRTYLVNKDLQKNTNQMINTMDILLKYGAQLNAQVNFSRENLLKYLNKTKFLDRYNSDDKSSLLDKKVLGNEIKLLCGTPLNHAIRYGCPLEVIKKLLVPTILALNSKQNQSFTIKENELIEQINIKINTLTKNLYYPYIKEMTSERGGYFLYNDDNRASAIKNFFDPEDPNGVRKKFVTNHFENTLKR